MLVLSRRVGEAVLIDGERIRVRILEVSGDTVRVGIDAARDIPILREEIFLAEAANRAAADAPLPGDLPALGAVAPSPPRNGKEPPGSPK
ncbi:MAG: carbon storage regulator [Clostridia bacterium]